MRWTPHMQECLEEIEARQENPLDSHLVQSVKIQLVVEKALQATGRDLFTAADFSMQPPPHLFAQEMLTQLAILKSSMIDLLSQDGESVFLCEYQDLAFTGQQLRMPISQCLFSLICTQPRFRYTR